MNKHYVRSIDANGDWNGGRGKNDYVSANLAIGQNIQTRLMSFLGDCFFKLNDGLDWFNLLGGKSELAIRQQVGTAILNTDGVTDIIQLSATLDRNTRALRISYEVNTIYTGVSSPSDTVTATTTYLVTESGVVITTEDGNPLTI